MTRKQILDELELMSSDINTAAEMFLEHDDSAFLLILGDFVNTIRAISALYTKQEQH